MHDSGGGMGKGQGGADGSDFTHHTQSGDMDCGLACLRMVRDWLGLGVPEPELRKGWSREKGIDPEPMGLAIASLVGKRAEELRSRDEVQKLVVEKTSRDKVQTLVAEQTANLLSYSEKYLLVLLISYWNEDGNNPRHWIIARNFRVLFNEFSTKKTKAKSPKQRELVALVHDPLQTWPYRQAWASILAAPVLHGFLLTNPKAQ
ncbi:hypothetical protein [Polyangium sp. 6x1]|uniref:hypothetical protein n=1 Tax=Polyangium sp. 6x1 TaxID=3042689 RepID=UPI0024829B60|nr:hypothetical protein [Polyangium sp. 6x1]MDI1448755.1 hypothetical protein [Polyangium sp. 6x1]